MTKTQRDEMAKIIQRYATVATAEALADALIAAGWVRQIAHPTGSEEFAAQLEHLTVPPPWRLSDETVGEILARDGAVVCEIDHEGYMPPEDATALAMYIILAVNTLSGFKAVLP